jgi:hypothetical protein
MDPISAADVDSHLRPDIRRLGLTTHSLIANWDWWIKRRVEQIELVSDASAKRRISVDFRLHREAFGSPVLHEGEKANKRHVHYVPLTLLRKAPFANFDLRDENNTAIPLLTKRMTASIGGATLIAATKNMVVQQLVVSGSRAGTREGISVAVRKGDFDLNSIKVPAQVEADFLNLCVFPYVRGTDGGDEPTAQSIYSELVKRTMGARRAPPVSEWGWKLDPDRETWSAEDIGYETLLSFILAEPTLNSLLFDFTRLYMVAAPVDAEPGRRRIIKMEYEEHLRQPGLSMVAGVRDRISSQARWLRRSEDWLEGLKPDEAISRREWTPPRSGMNDDEQQPGQQTQTLLKALAIGAGWLAKPISFPLPSVGLGGTFHLEVNAPAGTQIRRARLAARDKRDEHSKSTAPKEKAHRYARNVTRAHLYLGGERGELRGTSGKALMSIKPKSSTVIRGAAIAACGVAGLALLALLVGGSRGEDTQTTIAILLLAPGAVAVIAGQPFPSVTSGMIFGLRLLALSVAGVAIAIAALLRSHVTFCDQPAIWTPLVLLAFGLAAVLLEAWRLAGRDWPRRFEN